MTDKEWMFQKEIGIAKSKYESETNPTKKLMYKGWLDKIQRDFEEYKRL